MIKMNFNSLIVLMTKFLIKYKNLTKNKCIIKYIL